MSGPVLVTGGAGYVGSHVVLALVDAGREVVVLDDLSTGLRALVPPRARFIEGSIADLALAAQIMTEHRVEAVVHAAGSAVVPDSFEDPLRYYENNVAGSLTLLRAALRTGVRRFIFSSTAAVYRPPETCRLLREVDLADPLSPYGWSKLAFERMLADAGAASGLQWLALRYFNVAGADPSGRTGQATPKATHLIKLICEVALGRRAALEVYGLDHPTPDGSGVRDYIHASDLADAHGRGLDYLESGGASGVFNCGYGRPVSVKQVLAAAERVTGAPIPWILGPRRAGDAPYMVADSSALQATLGWVPHLADIDGIVASALAWERSRT